MSKPENEIEILQALQREAEELRAKRRQVSQEVGAQVQHKSSQLRESAGHLLDEAIETGKELEHDADQALHNLAARIETATAELEDVTRKRPIAALLTAATIGIVIGQILSRR
jgi:ElaB/YqjD/DUF883 family membrane-anchored ribosome-binding protein